MSRFWKSVIPFILTLLPVAVYLIYAFTNSSPLFFADDFHLLKTVVWMHDTDSLSEKFKLLIQQHNEHRIVVPRLLTYLDYKLEGHINWPTLIVVGNLLWIAVLWFFWKAFKSLNVPFWMFIPIPWIFLQPQYSDNVTWSISILQQSVIVFWFGLFCFLCAKRLYKQALIVAVMATFTHGNGIFSFLIGITFLSLDRNWKGALKWLGVLILVGLIYFWGFEKGQNADFQKSLSDPGRLIAAFFAFFGALTKVQLTNALYSVLCGAIFVLVLGVFLIPKLLAYFSEKRELTFFEKLLLGNVLFVGITAALICVSRSWGGVENVMAPRYQHYAPFVACWVYLVLILVTAKSLRNIVASAFILAAVLFNGLCYFVYNEEIVYRKNGLVADAENWAANHVFLNYASSFNQNIKEPYTDAVNEGICAKVPSVLHIEGKGKLADGNAIVTVEKKILTEQDASGSYQRDYFKIANTSLRGASFLYLQNSLDQKGYWLATRFANVGIRRLITFRELYKPGFTAEFLTENVPAGDYRIGILNDNQFGWTASVVTIQK
ncbi:hypothetical protein [Dyadobacter sp. CY323]|uniref:hypothetical protein n=1 Tax=Dyadobacter sp. CY323 TaxID=2907302 RepID=UPI001F38F69B|nr:hypothetical protein [Dyadobacter sp. CY323]MCE6991554.1 hypothetical protein [Dyadobacter sp. CY323]